VEHAVRLVKQVERENVGLTFNLCHWLKVSGPDNMLALMKEALPHLFSASINGADSGDTQKMNWTRLIQPLDAGTFDTYHFVKALTDLGFQGPIGLQCYNIKEKPEVHLKQSMQAWQILSQQIEANRLLEDL
jgi:sugar phosphate isomerase/epimerase